MTAASAAAQAFNAHDADTLSAMYTRQGVFHDTTAPRDSRGPGAIKRALTAVFTGIPDIRWEPVAQWAAGDWVVAEGKCSGTNTGRFFGQAPTGRPVSVATLEFMRFEEGKIAEHWMFMNGAAIAAQLAPEPAAAAAGAAEE
jgi:steroid delta-isomerase-like uncharacterized protein